MVQPIKQPKFKVKNLKRIKYVTLDIFKFVCISGKNLYHQNKKNNVDVAFFITDTFLNFMK